MSWKGLLLAGGTGSRLDPVTRTVNKHLLPVFDKPMIYYPLTTLMFADIRDITIVSTESGVEQIETLLGDGSYLGLTLSYLVQEKPGGIAEALLLAEEALRGHNIAMILGDNIFIGSNLDQILTKAKFGNKGATVFGYDVANPSAYGIVSFKDGKPFTLIEKPAKSKSRTAITGLYFFDKDVFDIARTISPSARGELEITDVNRIYLERGSLDVQNLGRGTAWLDGGTPGDLYEASQYVHVVQMRTGLRIAAPEEVAFRYNFISRDDLRGLIGNFACSDYRKYLEDILAESDEDSI